MPPDLDARRLETAKPDAFDRDSIFDLGYGEIDFVGCHQVLKSISYQGWLIVDLDTARQGLRAGYERCGAFVVNKLDPVYALGCRGGRCSAAPL